MGPGTEVRALEAVTLDLWGTIFHPRDVEEKVERRRAMILEALLEAGAEIDVAALRAAYRAAAKVHKESLSQELRDLGPAGRWALLVEQIGLPPDVVPYSRVAAAYEDLTLQYMPPLMEGVAGAIDRLRSAYRLGLICNTGFTGGTVLREVLKRHRLDRYFDVLVFSNEFGWLKPDPRIFHHTLAELGAQPGDAAHIGDLEELDVMGARAAGMLGLRYLPDGPEPSGADATFSHWDDVELALERALVVRSA